MHETTFPQTTPTIGVVGAQGDLGTQLVSLLRKHGIAVIECARRLNNNETVQSTIDKCPIVHICAPLAVLDTITSIPDDTIIVLHDSVMSSSRTVNDTKLDGKGAIVHMLMNDQSTVIIAKDAPHHDVISDHMRSIGLAPKSSFIDEHDLLMAKSQAPLALLTQTLLPYLYEQRDAGMLTPSGQLLVETLHSRALAWTPETIHSIMRNPQLQYLVDDMQSMIDDVKSVR
jgi:hypothetical protein